MAMEQHSGDMDLGDSREPPPGEEGQEEDSDQEADGTRRPGMLQGKTNMCYSSLEANVNHMKKKAEEMIEGINLSRQKDHVLMANFRESLKTKVAEVAEKLEERLYQIYDMHNHAIQSRLKELSLKMESIVQLEGELRRVCYTLETVYRDLCAQPETSVLEDQAPKEGKF